jgi:hypothetical protein
MQPYLWVWLMGAPLVLALIELVRLKTEDRPR